MKNYYDILGVVNNASEQDIKAAFRKLSLKYHPDRNPDDKIAEEKFKEINEAYQTLSDPDKRHIYDVGGNEPFGGFQAQDQINEILRQMGININFHQGSSDRENHRVQFKHQIHISLHDAVFGCEKEMDVPSYVNCKACNGIGGNKAKCHKCNGAGQNVTFLGTMQYPSKCVTCNGKGFVLISTCASCNQEGYNKQTKHLKLKIPAGIQNHVTLRVGSDPNDRCEIFIVVGVMQHSKINRNGATLFSTETISCLDAMIGGKKKIETIDGVYDLTIPPGTQQGQQLVIEGHGGVLTNGRANHIVNVHIEIPKNLSPEQIKKIKEVRDKTSKN